MPKNTCHECGTPLDPNNSNKPCPVCLLKLVAKTDFLSESDEPATENRGQEPAIDAVQRAFPQLEIIEQIGRGGMGTVFKARQPKLDRFVALKILSEELAAKATFAERFAREGKLLARLTHPNIVSVYDFGQAESPHETGKNTTFFYLLMEYVDGVNMRQAMREERFTPEQAIAIVPKICDALQYAHDEGVLHRDIKPENILLDVKGRVKIADFGIASVIRNQQGGAEPQSDAEKSAENETHLTKTGQILGTPSYMAPEQMDDPNRVDHRADIYSLGVVFYELLTGELPKGAFPLPSEMTPVGAEIDGIVLKALQKNRDKRQQSAVELKTEIETITANSAPKREQFPFFPDFLDFLEKRNAKNRVGMVLGMITCLIASLCAIIFKAPIFQGLAIGAISGYGGAVLIQYIIFRVRKRKNKTTKTAKELKTGVETTPPDLASSKLAIIDSWLFKSLFTSLITSLLLLWLGMACYIPGKLAVIPAARNLGYIKAEINLISPSIKSNEQTIQLLEQTAAKDDPRLVVCLAQKNVDDIILSDLKNKREERQNVLDKVVAEKSNSLIFRVAGWLTGAGIFFALVTFAIAFIQLLRLRITDNKRGLITNGLGVYFSASLFTCGIFSLAQQDNHELFNEWVFIVILIGTPLIFLISWAAKSSSITGRYVTLSKFAFACTLSSFITFAAYFCCIILVEEFNLLGKSPSLPANPRTLEARGLAVSAELDSMLAKLSAQRSYDFSAEWKKEYESQRNAALEAIRQEDYKNFGTEDNSEYHRIMWNARSKYSLQEFDLKIFPVVIIFLPLLALAIPGTVFGLLSLLKLRRAKILEGQKQAAFAGLLWTSIATVWLACIAIFFVPYGAYLIGGVIKILIISFTFLAWKKLNKIRKTEDKKGWQSTMIAALLGPCILLLGTFAAGFGLLGIYLFDGTPLAHYAGFICVIGVGYAVPIILLFIYLTYRWVFPAKPHPTQLAWWGLALVIASVLPILFASNTDEYFTFSIYSKRISEAFEQTYDLPWQKKLAAENEITNNPKLTAKQKEASLAQLRLAYKLQEQSRESEIKSLQDAMSRYNRFIQMPFVVSSIMLSAALALTGMAFGWCHLRRIAGTPNRPGMIPALIAAFAVTLPVAWLTSIGVWLGPIFIFDATSSLNWLTALALVVGNLLGVSLVVYIVWSTLRWQFRDAKRVQNNVPAEESKAESEMIAVPALPQIESCMSKNVIAWQSTDATENDININNDNKLFSTKFKAV
ncbi:MAG: serine/threonine protein kinase, partial [Thermoguttaceae bacterium]